MQSNTLCSAISDGFQIDVRWVGAVLAVLTLVIIFGGIQRIAHFSAVVVPFMAIGYILLALYVILTNLPQIPAMLSLIVKSAFGWHQAAGGAVGIAVMQGIRRGLFSNEAGEGSSPNAAATAAISHPVKQGLLQSLGVFTDTLVICSCTAFIILTAAIMLFAYSTIIANYFYGESNVRFITSKPWVLTLFRIASGIVVMLGGVMTLKQAWSVVDLAMALMTILNLIAVILLSRYAFRLLKDYKEQRRAGRDPMFHRSMFPDAKLDAWTEGTD